MRNLAFTCGGLTRERESLGQSHLPRDFPLLTSRGQFAPMEASDASTRTPTVLSDAVAARAPWISRAKSRAKARPNPGSRSSAAVIRSTGTQIAKPLYEQDCGLAEAPIAKPTIYRSMVRASEDSLFTRSGGRAHT